MAANKKPTSSLSNRSSPRITRILLYTLLEWTLIVLLLLNGLFSYLISKFALFFHLKPPCILCSQLNHLFEPQTQTPPHNKSYRRFLCDSHKAEVSQLGFCSLHRRLAEAGDMCEDCGSSRPAPGGGGAVLSWMRRSELGEKDLKCSCCGVALESGFYSPYFLSKPNWSVLDYTGKDDFAGKDAIFEVDQGRIVGFEVLDRIGEREGDHRDGDQKRIPNDQYKDVNLEPEEIRPLLPRNVEKDEGTEKELEIENSSRNVNSEVEEGNGLFIGFEEEPLIKLDDESIPNEIVGSSVMVPGNLNSDQNGAENGRMRSIELLDIGVVVEEEKNIVLISEQNSNALQEGVEETKEDLDISIGSEIGEQEQVATTTNDLISLSVNNQTGSEQQEVKVKEQLESSLVSLLDLSSAQLDDSIKGLGQIEIERADSAIPILDHFLHIEDSDGHGGHNGNQSEDEPETPTHTTNEEEDMHLLQRRLLFNKPKLGPGSADGLSLNSETESTTEPLTVDQLKSALQSERNALRAIYLELEEERSASAIAANQTMAMINRLQEEKAAMQMEALQYQRMMEEQSEYDQEALQMLNELVVKREKEKEEMEKALEAYRQKVVALERRIGRGSERSSGKRSSLETSSSSSSDSLEFSVALENGNDEFAPVEGHLMSLESSLDEFEEERKSILMQLKGLEEKLFSLEGSSDDDGGGGEKRSIDESQENGNHCQDCELLSDVLHVPGNGSINNNPQGKNSGYKGKRLLPLFDAVSGENGEDTGEENGDEKLTERERLSVHEEISEVYERLQALEADREFIRHCIKSLKKGDAGVDLLSEILQHLRDLRRVELQDTNSGGIVASLNL